jgi:HEAT repeat protein
VDAIDIDSLVADLAADSAVTRICARERLIEIGSPALPALIDALADRRVHVRWEAAKTLGGIADPFAAAPLVDRLEDKDGDVRWVAAMALVKIGPRALPPLARKLLDCSDSEWLREGAHHVCFYLRKDYSDELADNLLSALDTPEPELVVPVAAYEILKSRSSA